MPISTTNSSVATSGGCSIDARRRRAPSVSVWSATGRTVAWLAASETDGLCFVAAVDPVAERRVTAVADFPHARVYASAQELGDDDAVDIAVVATPPSLHADLAVALLDKGKHVVVEKPMCLTVDDADRMMAAALANDRVLTVHQSRRWDTDFLAVQRAVQCGLVGDTFNIETFVGGFEHPCRAWHSEQTISGGAVYDWGSHHIDWILALFGAPPARVVTHSHKRVWRDVTNADQVTVWMQWGDGREATFRQSDVAAIRRPKFFVQGTEGTLEGHYRPLRVETVEAGRGFVVRDEHHAEAPVDLRLVRYESGYGSIEQRVPPAPHPGWGFHRNLADHLLLGESLAVPPTQSRAVVSVLEAAQRAGANGSAIVDLDAARP
jgi:predicted dehydrogenase